MGYGIDTREVPAIRSYADAVAVYNETKPLRRTDVRPLGKRTGRAPLRISMDGEDVVVRMYNTDIARYKPNGEIGVHIGSWPTKSTCTGISAVTPFLAFRGNNRVCIRVTFPSLAYWALPSNYWLWFDARFTPINPVQPTVTKKRTIKDRAKWVRSFYKDLNPMITALAELMQGQQIDFGSLTTTTRWILVDVIPFGREEPITSEELSELANRLLPVGRIYNFKSHSVVNEVAPVSDAHIAQVRKTLYAAYQVVESYEKPLPMGEV